MHRTSGGAENPDLLWSVERLKAAVGTPGLSIVDTRQAEHFALGRIPGARHFDPYFVNCDDTDPAPLASFTRMWANMLGWRGATPDRKIIVYCNTGYRSAHAYLATRLLGYPHVRNYVGSWQEWGNREGLPIVRGA
jgi:thiosulfate/3-mercaptopyruvate sulfurtransferase